MTAWRGWGLPEQHLALDALVAFVDGELSASAHDRAVAHLARCSACASEAAAQQQARAAVRSAETPAVSAGLMQALQSIPANTELPAEPDGLALTEDGTLVALTPGRKGQRFGSGAKLGSGAPLGGGRPMGGSAPLGQHAAMETGPDEPPHRGGWTRRAGAGVVFSGIVLGALALVAVPDEQGSVSGVSPQPEPGGAYDTALIPASAGAVPPPTSTQPASATMPAAPAPPAPDAPSPSGPVLSTAQPR